MSTETPPTYYFSGIKFNPSFYTSSSSDYLTKQTAKSYFLSYPTAQGTETISTLNCAVLNTPSQTSNLDLGTNIINGTISMGDVQTNGVWAIAGVLHLKPFGVYIGNLYR